MHPLLRPPTFSLRTASFALVISLIAAAGSGAIIAAALSPVVNWCA